MPLVSQTFDQLLDFTRTSAATFVGSNGLIQNTPASVNLLTWTQQFDNAAWTKTAATVTANTTVAPDGTSTADTVAETATTASPWIRQQPNVTSGATYTGSVYVKKGGGSASRDFIQLVYNTVAFGANAYANFNIASGTVTATGAGVTASISDAGNGWYRCSITGTAISTGSGQFFIAAITSGSSAALSSYLGDVNATTFLWGAQLEAASAATTYTRNNGGVFPPRFDYDPVTLAAKGLLIEEQRTNLFTYSEQFDNAAWNKLNATVTANATVSPDGVADADALVEDTTNGSHLVQQFISFTTGTAYTLSFYVKAGTRSWVSIALPSAAFTGAPSSYYDLSGAGALGTAAGSPTSRTITAVGNGWYRITITATATATAGGNTFIRSATGDNAGVYAGVSGAQALYLYGAQLEAGAFATSYIPTVASQVTRTADICSIVAPNFAPWYNQSEGTLLCEFDYGTAASDVSVGNRTVVATTDGGVNNRNAIYNRAGTAASGLTTTGGTTQASPGAGTLIAANTAAKAAYAYASDNFAFSINGSAVATDASGAVPTVNQLNIGAAFGTVALLNGHVRSIRYYPTRLSDAQLQALTA